jgi:hypothetical protein
VIGKNQQETNVFIGKGRNQMYSEGKKGTSGK